MPFDDESCRRMWRFRGLCDDEYGDLREIAEKRRIPNTIKVESHMIKRFRSFEGFRAVFGFLSLTPVLEAVVAEPLCHGHTFSRCRIQPRISQGPFDRALMVLNSGYLGYDRG